MIEHSVPAWTCPECDAVVTDYSPGVCHVDGTRWLICGPCFNRYQAEFLPPERQRWEVGTWGDCAYCGRETTLRPEPFGKRPSCRDCFNQLIGPKDPA